MGLTAGHEKSAARARHDQILPILWRQRWLIIVSTALALGLGIVYLFVATPVYTSTARMKIVPAMGRMIGEQSLSDSINANYLQTESDLIQSPVVLALALQSPDVKPLVPADVDQFQFLQKYMGVEPGKHETVISVSFSSTDRYAASIIANAIVRAYQKYSVTPKQSTAGDVEYLQAQDQQLNNEIQTVSAAMAKISEEHGAIDPANPNNTQAQRQVDDLLRELHQAQRDTDNAKFASDTADEVVEELRKKGVDLESADFGALNSTPEGLAAIAAEINALRQRLSSSTYLPQHPAYRDMESRLNQLRLVQARTYQLRYRLAKSTENRLESQLASAKKEAKDVGGAFAKYAQYQNQLTTAQNHREQVQKHLSEIMAARQLGVYQIDIFEEARPELKPSQPNKITTLPISMALGLMLGCGLGLMRDWKDDRFRTIEEIKETLDVPLLGTAPRLPDGIPAPLAGQQAMLEPTSALAEACRSIRTAIYFGAPKERCRTIHITSPASGDGKSTLAANLAITMAQSGKRVLLIDADLRLSAQHAIFGIRPEYGLSSVLSGKHTLDQAVQPTSVSGLEVLPGGPQVSHPTEMLNSSMFNELLEVFCERYDQIIIDSPPVMGIADSRIIAASCDVTVLVLKAEKSTRRLSEMARDALTSVGANLLGIIINQIDASDGHPYGYYGYNRPKPAKLARLAAN